MLTNNEFYILLRELFFSIIDNFNYELTSQERISLWKYYAIFYNDLALRFHSKLISENKIKE